jgi:subtilisin family serine protease
MLFSGPPRRSFARGRSRLVEGLEARQLFSANPAALAAHGFEPVQWKGEQVYAAPRRFILRVDDLRGSAAGQLARVDASLKAVSKDLKAARQLGADGVVLVEAPKGTAYQALKAQLKGMPGFARLEPDFAVWADATANDAYYAGYQWDLDNTGQGGGTPDADVDAPEAWDVTRGDGSVVVGVIDSGVDDTHPDLVRQIWTNPGEVAGDGVDNDGNRYVDDVRGWDFANRDNDPMDDNGHGTHVAGTIAASANDGVGVAGIADAKIMPLKFLGADGSGYTSDAVAAINYATRMRRDLGVNVRVTNNSWGGGGFSQALADAVAANAAAGELFVVAAGNGGADGVGDDNDATPDYPANAAAANVVSVAATDRTDRLAAFSNYGASTVALAAPGIDILSSVPGGWAFYSGTSMAAPHVAGAAALAWSLSPAASVRLVRAALLDGADRLASLAGKVATGGRLNLARTLGRLAAPAARTYAYRVRAYNVTGESAASAVAVATVAAPDAEANQSPTVAAAAAATPGVVTGTSAALSVLGVDDAGEAALTYTWATAGTPPAPVAFDANGTNAAKRAVATFAKAGAYSFVVTVRDAAGATVADTVGVTVSPTLMRLSVSPATATVSTNGTRQFAAAATDQFGAAMPVPAGVAWSLAGGTGAVGAAGLYAAPAAAGTATVRAASGAVAGTAAVTVVLASPAAPTGLAATPASPTQVNLAWKDNANNETGYVVQRATDGGFTSDVVTTTLGANATGRAVTGLAANTTYYFRVRATNAAGGSAYANVAAAKTKVATVTYQAESAAVGGGTTIARAYAGYTGTGYADLPTSGGYVNWSASTAQAGAYTLSFRYALGAATARTTQLTVNGAAVTGGVRFATTGGWGTRATVSVKVTLAAEANALRLTTTGQDSANVDALTVIQS